MSNVLALDSALEKQKPLRVLFIGFAYIVGVYQSKLRAIQDTGCVEVAWMAPRSWKMHTWNRTIPLESRYPGFRVYPANIRFLNGINGGYLYPTTFLLNAIRDFRPDILHYEQEVFSLSAFQTAFWSKFLKIPLTVFCWENVHKKLPFYRLWTTRFVLHAADAIVAGNQGAATLLKTWDYQGNIFVMPQIGVDTDLFFPQPQEKNRVFTIGYVGRLVQEKGVDLILDAARHLLATDAVFRIVICGSGSHEPALRAHAARLGLENHVTWLGMVPHEGIPDVLANVNVVILPSRTVPGIWKEQFGHVLVEAMAMRIPVIGSDSGAIPEVIGRNDLIFPENNSEELAKIIKRLITDDKWSTEISEFLENRAISEYSDQRIAEFLISMWRDVLAQNRESLHASKTA